MKLSAVGEIKHVCMIPISSVFLYKLPLYPPPPPPTHTVLIYHPKTSRLTDSGLGSGGGATTPSHHRLVGWPTVMEGEGWGWGMRAGAGGRCYHAPMLLGAEVVELVFWALRWKEKGEHSHNLWLHSNNDNKRCRRICGMKISTVGECAEWN